MCITIEPGLYFREYLFTGKFMEEKSEWDIDVSLLNVDLIREYMKEIEGVRIEDDVLITADGCENLSWGVPRKVEDVEKCMAGKNWLE